MQYELFVHVRHLEEQLKHLSEIAYVFCGHISDFEITIIDKMMINVGILQIYL
jgi:hypothetical protein